MVRLTLKPRRFDASCCRVAVVNGAGGVRRLFFAETDRTSRPREACSLRVAWAANADPSSVNVNCSTFSPRYCASRAAKGGGPGASASTVQYSRASNASISDSRSAIEAKGRALHPSGREVRANLRPEHRRQVEPDEVVEGAAGELGVHQVGLKLSRMLERLADRAARDLVELHPVHRLVCEHPALRQELGDVPRDRLALAVGVGGEIEGARAPHRPHDRLHVSLRARNQIEVHGEAALGLDRPGGGDEVAHVPIGGEHGEIGVQVLSDGASLRRGLDDEEPPPPRPGAVPALPSGPGRGGRAGFSLRSAGGGRLGGLTGRGHSDIPFVSVAGDQHTRM